jgi:TATA element modulatory factor
MFSGWGNTNSSADNDSSAASWAQSWVHRVSNVIDKAESGIDRLVGVQSTTEEAPQIDVKLPVPSASLHSIHTPSIPSTPESIAGEVVYDGGVGIGEADPGYISVAPSNPIPTDSTLPNSSPLATSLTSPSTELEGESATEELAAPAHPSPLDEVYIQQLQHKSEQIASLLEENRLLKEAAASISVDALTVEFSSRISQLERKYQVVLKDRDALKKKLTGFEAVAQAKPTTADQAAASASSAELAQKEGLIRELRYEGEQLQTRIIKYEASLKKLRSEKKQLQDQQNSLTQQNDEIRSRLKAAEDRVLQLSELERRHESTLDGMKHLSEATRTEVEELREKCRQATDKSLLLQQQLEESWAEGTSLKKQLQELILHRDQDLSSAELQLRDQLNHELKTANADSARRESHLQSLVTELRSTLDSQTRLFQVKEEDYESRIASLTLVMQEQESRIATLSSSSSNTSKPLLRQISDLQLQLQSRDEQAASLEASMRAKLTDEEARLVLLEREKHSVELQLESMQKQVVLAKLSVDASESRAMQLENEIQRLSAVADSSILRYQQLLEQLETSQTNCRTFQQHRIEAEAMVHSLRSQLATAEVNIRELTQLNNKLLESRQQTGMSLQPNETASTERPSGWFSELETLQTQLNGLKSVEAEKIDLEQRYLAALELLGEQTERVHELEDDIMELKKVYKQQIDQLVQSNK